MLGWRLAGHVGFQLDLMIGHDGSLEGLFNESEKPFLDEKQRDGLFVTSGKRTGYPRTGSCDTNDLQ